MEQKLFRHFGKNTSWYFTSSKNFGKTMRAESFFEICVMYFLEFDDTVVQYQAQPNSYIYFLEGEERRYTPDFLLKMVTGEYQLIELKPQKYAQKTEFLQKHGHLNDYFLRRYNIPLSVWTEENFYNEVLITNYRRFYCYRSYDFSRYCMKTALNELRGCEVVADVYATCKRLTSTDAFAPALLANRIVTTDFYSDFTMNNAVEVKCHA
jgi:hypothetical protein